MVNAIITRHGHARNDYFHFYQVESAAELPACPYEGAIAVVTNKIVPQPKVCVGYGTFASGERYSDYSIFLGKRPRRGTVYDTGMAISARGSIADYVLSVRENATYTDLEFYVNTRQLGNLQWTHGISTWALFGSDTANVDFGFAFAAGGRVSRGMEYAQYRLYGSGTTNLFASLFTYKAIDLTPFRRMEAQISITTANTTYGVVVGAVPETQSAILTAPNATNFNTFKALPGAVRITTKDVYTSYVDLTNVNGMHKVAIMEGSCDMVVVLLCLER